ncbi:hypothetical protein RND71_043538 [Anisodus tanguticus]|uniref:Phosphatidylinositol transfer protein N-terminal domain-containing protein n=1 Tax=Anisodus tanguticus TaxID=243964 RepID=A0AAE1QSQ3_9SOLA|nr:hypothetical protein RND71_043538 [Anisodus tanguticus]
MPLTVEEYQIGQLFSVAEASKNQTGGGEGVEVVKNEPFENYDLLGGEFTKGQYTYKIYHLASRVPNFIKIMIPKSMLEIHEEAWNAYPYCRTVLTNPFMKDDFFLRIETMHYPDDGQQPNIHKLPPEKLNKREVIFLDIANDPVSSISVTKEISATTRTVLDSTIFLIRTDSFEFLLLSLIRFSIKMKENFKRILKLKYQSATGTGTDLYTGTITGLGTLTGTGTGYGFGTGTDFGTCTMYGFGT